MKRRILITGASTGIGAQTARELAEGNLLFLHYYSSREAMERVAAGVRSKGGEVHVVRADLRTEQGCTALFREVSAVTDRLDVLFNNAGGLIRRCPAGELDWELMLETFSLNTFSAMKVTSLFLPLLRKGKDPCVINNSSIAARTGAPSAVIYGACKGAVDTLTRGLARELAPQIRVNAVAPGVIDTPFHQKVSSPERMREFAQATALQRIGEARHIAMAVRLLIENDFLTGETIDVNGGLFMR
jgi:3-oxoacyl-[acyl-carrier protein] reductase